MNNSITSTEWFCSELKNVTARMKLIMAGANAFDQLREITDESVSNTGKLVRPTLLLLCAGSGYGESVREELLDTAAAIEITHTASLIHDDVIDDAPLRRGKPTVQSRYGKCTAVYAGDFLLSGAMRHMMEKGYAASGAAIAHCVERMCAGEMVQLRSRGNVNVTEEKYMEAIAGKTAALFETACRLGSTIAGGDSRRGGLLGSFGMHLGIMFQLRDDILDWSSSEEASGKPVNEDFAEGIYTVPAIHAFASEKYGGELREIAGLERQNSESLERARELVRAAGGLEYGRELMLRHREEALECLSQLPKNECMEALGAMTGALSITV